MSRGAAEAAEPKMPPPPANARWVAPHSGAKDEKGRLKPFKDGPAHFRPTLTPREMLLKGMHGGIYFNPLGGKPGVKYPRSKYPKGIPGVGTAEFPDEWFQGVPSELYKSRRYSVAHNHYGVKSGLDQAGWESSGWINSCDPRGWTQWYFRYFLGRRLGGGEDERQIARWSGVCGEKGRWKQNLIAKCLRDGKSYDDASVSPVVRQTLLHWAYELGEGDFAAGARRVKTHGATYVPREELAAVMTKKGASGVKEAPAPAAAAPAGGGESGRSKRARERAEGSTEGGRSQKRPRAHAEEGSSGRRQRGGGAERSARGGGGEEEAKSEYERQRDETKEINRQKLVALGLA